MMMIIPSSAYRPSPVWAGCYVYIVWPLCSSWSWRVPGWLPWFPSTVQLEPRGDGELLQGGGGAAVRQVDLVHGPADNVSDLSGDDSDWLRVITGPTASSPAKSAQSPRPAASGGCPGSSLTHSLMTLGRAGTVGATKTVTETFISCTKAVNGGISILTRASRII